MKIRITKEEKEIEGTIEEGAVKPFGTSAHILISKKHLGKVVPVIIPIEPKYIWLLNESEKKKIMSEARKIIVEENGQLEFHRLSMLKDLERRTFDLDSLQKILILLESKGKEKELTKKIRKLYQMQ